MIDGAEVAHLVTADGDTHLSPPAISASSSATRASSARTCAARSRARLR
ncbi:MAG: hypothetical protein ACK559_17780 [bacterium]